MGALISLSTLSSNETGNQVAMLSDCKLYSDVVCTLRVPQLEQRKSDALISTVAYAVCVDRVVRVVVV